MVADIRIAKPTYWRTHLLTTGIAISVWILEFFLQYCWLARGEIVNSLVRSFALAGATLVSTALFSSVIFRLVPRTAQYWRFRRHMGVWGFIFLLSHAFSVYYFFFDFDFATVYYTLNPIENPIVFGTVALCILFLMAARSGLLFFCSAITKI